MDTSSLFGHSHKARLLALKLTHGEDAVLGQLDLQERDVEDIIDENKWLRNWSAAMCEIAGEDRGTADFEACQRQMAQRAISSGPMGMSRVTLGAPEATRRKEDCFACSASPDSLLEAAHALGREIASGR